MVRKLSVNSPAQRELTLVTLDSLAQVNALVRLLAAIALDVRGAGLAHGTAVLALRNRPPFLVDVLERTICSRTANVSTARQPRSKKLELELGQ